jgi:hypothetical protein
MRARELLVLVGALCLAAAAGIVFLSQDSQAGELSPEAPVAAAAAEPEAAPPPSPVASSPGPDLAPAVASVPPASGRAQVDTTGWTKGLIKGDIQLAVSVLDRLTTITVIVEEARSAVSSAGFHPPHSFHVPVKLGVGTPTFEVRDVPFSEYPYVVSVHAPGLNGNRRTVTLDATNPIVDDVVLTITPGAPFTVLVRDQDSNPFVGVDVRLLPVGEPLGRPRTQATTDNFGSIAFENVLAGDYQLLASQSGQSLGEPQTVTVHPGRSVSTAVVGQGHVLTIPRGVPLQLQVNDAAGYGVAGAKVTATATDKVKLTMLEAMTNDGGRADLPHLTPGVWHVVVEKDKFARRDQNVTIKSGQTTEYLEMRMPRLRF